MEMESPELCWHTILVITKRPTEALAIAKNCCQHNEDLQCTAGLASRKINRCARDLR